MDDTKVIEENFTPAQVGELFLAVMAYIRDGTVRELPPELKFPFAQYRAKVDQSKAKYEEKCAKLAENGAKGGKAKAEKAAGDHQPDSPKVKFTPPTLKQFRNAVTHFYENDDLGDCKEMPDDYSVDRMYNELKEAHWQIDGEPIQTKREWEMLIQSRFANWSFLPFSDEPYTKYIFGKYHGLRDSDGKTQADIVACDFCEEYSAEENGWTVGGEFYPKAQWQEALDKYVTLWQEKQSSKC